MTVAFIAALSLSVPALGADETPPETIRIFNTSVFKDHRKGPVTFSHQKHATQYKVLCRECHHVYENRQNVWEQGVPVQTCDTCHREKKDPRVDKLQNAFHKNCRGCHRDIGKGPYKNCAECHAELAQ